MNQALQEEKDFLKACVTAEQQKEQPNTGIVLQWQARLAQIDEIFFTANIHVG